MSKLFRTESICRLRGKHTWIPPWWKGRRICALCGRHESLAVGNNTIQLSPGGVDIIKWSGTVAPSAGGELGMDVTTGLPQCYTAGAPTALAVGGGAAGGLTLIEKKTFTSTVQQYDFTGLNGNSDFMYFLTYNIYNAGGNATTYYIQPNAITSNQSSKIMKWATTANVSAANYAGMRLGESSSATDYEAGYCYLFANATSESQAFRRSCHGMSVMNASGNANGRMQNGIWKESSTNITSLRIYSSFANGIGQGSEVVLYKLAQS